MCFIRLCPDLLLVNLLVSLYADNDPVSNTLARFIRNELDRRFDAHREIFGIG